MLNIDIPIALGIVIFFIRSTFDIVMDYGPGFFRQFDGVGFLHAFGQNVSNQNLQFLEFRKGFQIVFSNSHYQNKC